MWSPHLAYYVSPSPNLVHSHLILLIWQLVSASFRRLSLGTLFYPPLIFPERLSLKFNDVDTSYEISFRLNPTFSTKKFWSISSILTGHTDFAATVSSLTSRRLPDVVKIQVSSIVHKAYLHVILISHEVSWFIQKLNIFVFKSALSLMQNWPLKSDV